MEEIGEFGLGIAPRQAKPVNKIEISKERQAQIDRMQEEDGDGEGREDEEEDGSKMEIIRLRKQRDRKRRPVERQAAFIEFKGLPEGKGIEDLIVNNRQELKDKKGNVK